MNYTVVYPRFQHPIVITADSFKEAIKEYVKMKYAVDIHQMIIKDQWTHMNADLRYYRKNNIDKVGINMYPICQNYIIPQQYSANKIHVNPLLLNYVHNNVTFLG